MQHRFTKTFAIALVFALSLAGTASAGVTVFEKGDTNIKVGGLLQAWGTLTQDASPDNGLGSDFYLRRMRLMTYGQLNKKVNFFIETDNPNFGKDGDFSTRMFIQDAYLELNLSKYFQLDMGLLLAPFSHHGMQGATTLLGLDYHAGLARYAPSTNIIWRGVGLMARGMFLDGMLEYRVAVLAGAHGNDTTTVYNIDDANSFEAATDPRNPSDVPRVTARLTYNLFDAEGGPGAGGMFYDGLYLKKTDEGIISPKKIVSFGASVDWQHQLNVILETPNPSDPAGPTSGVADRSDYIAAAVDAFIDLPLDEARLMSLNGQVNFYYYNHGDRAEATHYYNLIADKAAYTGYGLMSELGFRYDAFQPIVIFDWYNADDALNPTTGELSEDQGDYMAIRGGLNYFMLGHRTTFKIDLGSIKKNGGDWGFMGTLQAQLLF